MQLVNILNFLQTSNFRNFIDPILPFGSVKQLVSSVVCPVFMLLGLHYHFLDQLLLLLQEHLPLPLDQHRQFVRECGHCLEHLLEQSVQFSIIQDPISIGVLPLEQVGHQRLPALPEGGFELGMDLLQRVALLEGVAFEGACLQQETVASALCLLTSTHVVCVVLVGLVDKDVHLLKSVLAHVVSVIALDHPELKVLHKFEFGVEQLVEVGLELV